MRALTPHVGAYLELEDGERLGVVAARAQPGTLAAGRGRRSTMGCAIGTADGVLALLEVRPAGRQGDGRRRLPARPRAADARRAVSEVTAARRVAYEILRRTFEDGAWTDRAFTPPRPARASRAATARRRAGSPTARSSAARRATT